MTSQATTPTTLTVVRSSQAMRSILLLCGIVSSILYIVADNLAAMRRAGYSYTSQSVSELLAIGAPTRPFLVLLFTVCSSLSIAFSVGVFYSSERKRPLQVASILIAICRNNCRAPDIWRSRRDAGPRLAANSPTPWLGIEERVNIYASLLWSATLAVVLLQSKRAGNVAPALRILDGNKRELAVQRADEQMYKTNVFIHLIQHHSLFRIMRRMHAAQRRALRNQLRKFEENYERNK